MPRSARAAIGGGGAIAAQVSQALASLLLQVLVARTLGDVGLATYALLYGGVVLATAVGTGLVGDTLTVVDRALPRTRAGLQWWSAAVAAVLGVAAALTVALGTELGSSAAVVFGVAVAAFVLEDLLRRLLMATGRFWSVVLVDGTALLGSLATVLVTATTGGGLGLADFLLGLALGQVLACGTAVLLLPGAERWLAPWRRADLRVVFGFGAWRAAQQVLRPGMLTGARIVVIAGISAAAYGQLEAARLLATPLALVVSGTGNLLLVSYARAGTRATGLRALRRADLAAVALVGAAVALGAAATAATPLLAPLVTAGAFELETAAVAGWVLYAATSAVLLPYATLAAVQGRQRAVFGTRLLDSAASLGLVAALVLLVDGRAVLVPFALSVGSLLSAVVVRQLVVLPLARRADEAAAVVQGEGPPGPRRS